MKKMIFKWDDKKNAENQKKHSIPFNLAQHAFADPLRIIAEDVDHSMVEKRYMKDQTEYTDVDLGNIKIIPDFLPAPENLIFKQENIKVTISLSKNSIHNIRK